MRMGKQEKSRRCISGTQMARLDFATTGYLLGRSIRRRERVRVLVMEIMKQHIRDLTEYYPFHRPT